MGFVAIWRHHPERESMRHRSRFQCLFTVASMLRLLSRPALEFRENRKATKVAAAFLGVT